MSEARAARLVAWGNAWLAGLVGLDELTDVVQGDDESHVVVGDVNRDVNRAVTSDAVSDLADGDTGPLALTLGQLRRSGASHFQLALPVAGDVSSLPGPADLNRLALEVGEVALVGGATPCALVPEVTAHGSPLDGYAYSVTWQLVRANPPRPLERNVRGAAAELAEAMREATASLTRLDVAGAGADVLGALARSRETEVISCLPAGHPDAAHALLARCDRLGLLLELAEQDAGAAVTQHEMQGRTGALRGLATAVRRAREVAYSSCEAVASARPSTPSPSGDGVLDVRGRS